jgi:hypothetical protein
MELARHGAKRLPWPAVGHQKVVERILAARHPVRDERGYRDLLVWESILAHIVSEKPDTCVFVTSDSDFLDGSSLHPDLVEDLRRLQLEPRCIAVERLAALNEREFKPTLARLDQVAEQLQNGTYPGVNLDDYLKFALEEHFQEDDLAVCVDVDPRIPHSVHLSKLEHVAFDVIEVRQMSSAGLLVEVSAACTGEVHVSQFDEDYWTHASFKASVDLVIENGEISAADIAGVDGDYGRWHYRSG